MKDLTAFANLLSMRLDNVRKCPNSVFFSFRFVNHTYDSANFFCHFLRKSIESHVNESFFPINYSVSPRLSVLIYYIIITCVSFCIYPHFPPFLFFKKSIFTFRSLARLLDFQMGSRVDGDIPNRNFVQNVVVMRHGDRIDNFEPLWAATAARTWDPPLIDAGKVRAYNTGRRLRTSLDFQIQRVFVSPFLRCLQTASEVVSALCAIDDDPTHLPSPGLKFGPFKVKVSVEYGLSEMMNKEAIRQNVAPKDGKFDFNISECEALLPSGTVDHTVETVYEELPKWGESVAGARSRYEKVFRALADKFPSDNLLIVTHGEGVGVAVTAFLKNVSVYEVEYCAYSHSRRHVYFDENQQFTTGEFEVLRCQSGVRYCSLTNAEEDQDQEQDAMTYTN